VLYSASYQPRHPFLLFWTSTRVQIVTSLYAVDEARRNISSESHLDSLNSLLAQTQLITDYGDGLPEEVSLPPKDRPIFCAAIAAGARYLVTGDRKHFGRYFDQTFDTTSGPLTVIEPASLLRLLKKSH
jgi:hypothetical protein